jgi:hypothetical protein
MSVDTTSQPVAEAGKQRKRHRFWVVVLLVVGTLLTPITIMALFVNTQISDTGRYVQNVEPLASDPAIQAYVADTITNRLFDNADVESYIRDVLPPRADRIVGPLASAMKNFVHEATLRVLQSSQFQTLWKEANRVAHTQIVRVLEGNGKGTVSQDSSGTVTLDLSKVVEQVTTQLKTSGVDLFSHIPVVKIGGQVPLFQSKDLYKIRHATSALNKLAFVLPFLVFGSFGGAIWLSRSRRKGFFAAAVCFALGALVLGVGITIGRHFYLNATGSALPHDAAAAAFDTLIRFLRTSVRAALIFSIIIAIAVFFSGASRLATWFRTSVRRIVNFLGRQTDDAGWGFLGAHTFFVRNKRTMRIIVAAGAFVILFFWKHPTPMVIFWTGVITLVLLALIEFFGREPLPATEPKEITLTEPTPAVRPTGSTV